ncbi:MAG TPA: L,D-transpeptidase family protein [Jatrophihabitantaceae bacterium]|nr:L,D-transpeptidase family protein [Jatrophihabitantaceae bacterium]
MGVGRVVSSAVAVATVAGGAVLVVAMGRAGAVHGAGSGESPPVAATSATGTQPDLWPASSDPATPTPSSSSVPATSPTSAARSSPARTSAAPRTSAAAPPAPSPTTKPPTSAAPPPVRGQALPIGGTTSGASRVITVVASSYSSTTATLQAWDLAPGGGWLKHGAAVTAHVGADGLSTHPSESRSATPIGSFTLTQAFGAMSNPGTGLPYFRTDSADWWISQSGPLYNTHQHCGGGCAFTQGAPNEHLAYELPYYDYAVVIDYNTQNSPTGVVQGAGSAFFLHVTDGTPTAGCVAIPQSNLVSIMQWLAISAHPRIIIGVA